ncbi:hypothetical protein IAR50_003232 [Cryptococcus sp. DSM 104548]
MDPTTAVFQSKYPPNACSHDDHVLYKRDPTLNHHDLTFDISGLISPFPQHYYNPVARDFQNDQSRVQALSARLDPLFEGTGVTVEGQVDGSEGMCSEGPRQGECFGGGGPHQGRKGGRSEIARVTQKRMLEGSEQETEELKDRACELEEQIIQMMETSDMTEDIWSKYDDDPVSLRRGGPVFTASNLPKIWITGPSQMEQETCRGQQPHPEVYMQISRNAI